VGARASAGPGDAPTVRFLLLNMFIEGYWDRYNLESLKISAQFFTDKI
jgi:hypothetical protein